jgi:hypothetical protein
MVKVSRSRRTLLAVSVVLAILPAFLALAPSPTLAAASHENTNPYSTGCMTGSYAISSKAVSGGTVSIMVSDKCATNWVQYSGATQSTTKYGKAAGKNWTNTEVDYAAKSWSLQSYAPGTTAYTGVIKIGNTTTTATCGNGCTWTVSGAASSTTSIANFVSATQGKSIANASGSYAGECVSLVSQFLLQVWGITTGAWGNAIDYRSGGTGGNQLSSRGFYWSTSQSFQNGDILVWGAGSRTGSLGHIGIYYNGQIYDQNNAVRVNPRTANYSGAFWSSGFLGRWRK